MRQDIGDIDWLVNPKLHIVIGSDWREKQRQVRALPRWFYEPSPNVRRYFDFRRGLGDEPDMTPEDWEDVEDHIRRDPVAFLWHFCYLKDRDTRVRKLCTPTAPQLVLLWRFAALNHHKMPIRIDLLKERQGGFSWEIEQLIYWSIRSRENRGALSIAHEKDVSRRMFSYLRETHEWMPPQLRPAHTRNSRGELYLAEPSEEKRLSGETGLESFALVQTAGNEFAGTGTPVQVLHCSEVGKWHRVVSDPAVLYTSLINAMQDVEGTIVFRESTAHGAATFWHECVRSSARDPGTEGWSGFCFIFLPWFFDERNVKKAAPDMQLCAAESDEFGNELAYRTRFGLDDAQLEWRRRAIIKQVAESHSKTDWFAQEHPATVEEAWLHAHGRWLDANVITVAQARLEQQRRDGLLRVLFQGDMQPLRERGPDARALDAAMHGNEWLRRRLHGPLTIYRWPDPTQDYIAGGDVAEGLEHGDASCLKIYQRIGNFNDGKAPLRLAAEYYGRVDDDRFADVMWRLGWFYATGDGPDKEPAMLAWERTGAGRAIARYLRRGTASDQMAYPINRLYRRHDAAQVRMLPDVVFGIQTTQQTKPAMLAEWKRAVRDGDVQLTEDDISEMESLLQDDNGRVETGGRDRVMASVMACFAAMFVPIIFPKVGGAPPEAPRPGTVRWALESARSDWQNEDFRTEEL